MKRFSNWTQDELAVVTEEEVEELIELECANSGVPLPSMEVPEPISVEVPKPDKVVYEVPQVLFEDRSEAENVISEISKCTSLVKLVYKSYYGRPDYHQEVVPYDDDIRYETRKYWTPKEWDEKQERYISTKTQVEAYDKAIQEFRDKRSDYDEIANPIRRAIGEAKAVARRKEFLKTALIRYRELADGDEHIARKFLVDAYPDAEEIFGW